MNLIILGSRTFEPIDLVDAEIVALPADATVTAFGSADVCKRAVMAAESRGLDARNVVLSPSRAELLDAAQQPGAAVIVFTALSPATKQITEGTSQLLAFMTAQGISARQIASPLPGKVCELMTTQRQAVDKALETSKLVHRRRYYINRALQATTALTNERDAYEERLTVGMPISVGDEFADSKWAKWLFTYERLCDAIRDATVVLRQVEQGVAA